MSNQELEREETTVLDGTTIERDTRLTGPKTDNATTWRVVDPSDEIKGTSFVWLESQGGDRWIGHEELDYLLATGQWEVQQ